jgi:hypothetical protein
MCATAAQQFVPENEPGYFEDWGKKRIMIMDEAFERDWVMDNKLRLACYINVVCAN